MFTKLKVKEIKRETDDAVSIAFEIPTEFKAQFNYKSGQYITIKANVGGDDVRRAYSLCSTPLESDFRIGVKKVFKGKMSNFLNNQLNIGDELEVMNPSGNFVINNLSANNVGIAAGSGITPIFSIAKTVLAAGGNFTLLYGNVKVQDVIFKAELDKLKEKYTTQFSLHYTYDEGTDTDNLYNGRIDGEKINALAKVNLKILKSDGFYMCGPEQMIQSVSDSLKKIGVNENKIHFELFAAPTTKNDESNFATSDFTGESQVTVIMDGDEFEFPLKNDGGFILDVAIENGADAPFSCKGAVCCTCKAQVIEGKAIMELNYSLSDEEVADGFILTCQAHPASAKLVVDYDVS